MRTSLLKAFVGIAVSGGLTCLSTAALAGPQTYSRCANAAAASPVNAGQQSTAWSNFCQSVPLTSSYKFTCSRENLTSRQSKQNFCYNFRYDDGETP